MKLRNAFIVACCTSAMLMGGGCRAIVGIEDLHVDDGGATGLDASSGGSDSSVVSDGKNDAPPDAKPVTCNNGGSKEKCRECCRNANFPGYLYLVRGTGAAPCYCPTCGPQCLASACKNPPDAKLADQACFACMDQNVLDGPVCKDARDDCELNGGPEGGCKTYLECIKKCPP